MGHLLRLKNNCGLAIGRAGAVIGSPSWDICFIANFMTELNLYRRGGNNLFPLWLTQPEGVPRPNLAPKFLEQLAASLGLVTQAKRHDLPRGVQAEDVLAYIYAVLHAPSYRARYAQYLKSDFPRIPIAVCPESRTTFTQVWKKLLPLGRTLMDLHLLKKAPPALQAHYPQAGDNQVEKPRFVLHHGVGRVYINAHQYFDRVPEETWAFKIGGYQVCEKWLKDRKDRTLGLEEIEHYKRIVAALTQTRALMQDIDSIVHGQLWPQQADWSADPE